MRRHRLATTLAFYSLPLALVACGEKPASDPRTEFPQVRIAVVDGVDTAFRSFTETVAVRSD